jgi:hypothetical protein
MYISRKDLALNTRKWKSNIRKQLLIALGGKCVRCGFSDWRALQIDHIEHVGKNRESWSQMVHNILEANTEKYQLLCANCNTIKKHEKREFNIKYHDLEVFPVDKAS